MPRRRYQTDAEPVPQSKPARDLNITVSIEAPWGVGEARFRVANAAGNISRPKQNTKAWARAILAGLQREFGGQVKQV